MISRTTVRNNLFKNFIQYRSEIAQSLNAEGNGKLSATTDLWTSENHHAIMAVTVAWLNRRFEMNEVILGFRKVLGKHDGANLAKVFIEILSPFNIKDKV